MVSFLQTIRPPKDLTPILSWHVRWLGDRFPGANRLGSGVIEAILTCGVRWSEASAEHLIEIRRSLLHAGDYEMKRILTLLKKPEICAPMIYQELVRTPRMQERLVAIGLVKKPIPQPERDGKLPRRRGLRKPESK